MPPLFSISGIASFRPAFGAARSYNANGELLVVNVSVDYEV